jgi:electron transfer flavoprotein beta subunit
VPAQVAANLNLNHLNRVIDLRFHENNNFIVSVDSDSAINSYQVKLLILLCFVSTQNYKLPFVKFENLELNVDQRFKIVTNQQLLFASDKFGFLGSPTKVLSTSNKLNTLRKQIIISEAIEGANYLYKHLKDKGFIKS